MADPVAAAPNPPSQPDPTATMTAAEFDALPIPPLDPTIFSQDLALLDCNSNNIFSFGENDFMEDLDFDFTFDDLSLPSDTDDFLNGACPTLPASIEQDGSGHPVQIDPNCFNQTLPDPGLRHISIDRSSRGAGVLNSSSAEQYQASDNPSSSGIGVSNSGSLELCQVSCDRSSDVAGYLNVLSPESGGLNRECSQESGNKGAEAARALNHPSPGSETHDREASGPASSQGSGNCGSAVLESHNWPSPESGNCAGSVNSSPNLGNNAMNGAVDQKIKVEELGSNCLLKRKKVSEDVNSESRTGKHRKSGAESATTEEEDKRKARLMRNRESAQLSRQRKKHYVEELEDKVRAMHSTIQDLNAKVSYMMSENASLRQQLGNGGMCPPTVHPSGMYPHPPMAPMGYPWMPCPPYVVKPQGSQVPLLPIPRLKPQQPVSASKYKKVERKKSESKTKKVASVSFLGLFFFILLLGGLVPMVNVKYGGVRDSFAGGLNAIGSRFYDQHMGRVLTVNNHFNGTNRDLEKGMPNENCRCGKDFTSNIPCGKESGSHPLPHSDEFVNLGNGSEPLVASLYVPRNDKLVKIDGNLIIHSVMASERAMASQKDPGMNGGSETSLAVRGNLAPAIPVPRRYPHLYISPSEGQRALASGSEDKDNLKSTAADGRLQQWFREGLAGPMLSSGMCTEVFQFDVSPASAPGAIVLANKSMRNVSEHRQNSTHINKGRNRRILHNLPIPLSESADNITKEHMSRNSEEQGFHGNNSLSSVVVSVLVDPREAGDGDGDGMMGPKSLSRIFVVVLLNSVKYVTYSCVLPLKGSVPNLVTT